MRGDVGDAWVCSSKTGFFKFLQARHWGCDGPAWLVGLRKYDGPACRIYARASKNMGAIFLERKRLRQRTHKFGASKNMGAILGENICFARSKGPHISGSPELVGSLPQLFFPRKIAPRFLEAGS